MILDNRLDFRLPADAASVAIARKRVVAWAEQVGLAPSARESLGLAVGEAAGNAVVHGDRLFDVEIRARREGNDCVVEVESSGEFVPETDPSMPDPTAERGRGRALMVAMVDSVEYLPASGRTLVRLRKRV